MSGISLDVITIGRSSVDLYGEQVGGRLEDMGSFAKYLGGCPANIAVGGARLGLATAVVTGVGDEHMGRFLREVLQREGVDVSHVRTIPECMTALVILGIQNRETFPLIFYRENCADMALVEDDVDEAFLATARAIVVTGTHFSAPQVAKVSHTAMKRARSLQRRVILDIDYRPVLWGLTGKGLGEERFVADHEVTAHLLEIVPSCDLIVGTEEEFHIAGGSTDTVAALRKVREHSGATLVLKRGPMGCSIYEGDIPDHLDDGLTIGGFPVEVFNVLGAGDAFMSGFLRGWLRDEPLDVCARWANACGAFAVSRHGCAPAVPSFEELMAFLAKGSSHFRLREDPAYNHLHWVTTGRASGPDEVLAFAFDHRSQFAEMAQDYARDDAAITAFKSLCLDAVLQVAETEHGTGLLCDERFGQSVLDRATEASGWIARPVEMPGSRPLVFEKGPDLGSVLNDWPKSHCVKCLVNYDIADPVGVRTLQEEKLLQLYQASRHFGLELLVEVIPPGRDGGHVADQLGDAIARLYEIGIRPDWWKLPDPQTDTGWRSLEAVITSNDPHCRGVLVLGLNAPEEELADALARAAAHRICRGFAIGRTLFGQTARSWFAQDMDDRSAVAKMASDYRRMIGYWRQVRS